MQRRCWKLSPSDFAFLWQECLFCFYAKVVLGMSRPRTPMPKIFTILDGLMKTGFAGMRTETLAAGMPPGVVAYDERWVESQPIVVPGHTDTVFLRGKFDVVAELDDRTFGVIDFKTAERRGDHVPLYGRQLHAYAFALENPARGRLSLVPVSTLGLLCFQPDAMVSIEGRPAYAGSTTYIPVKRDDAAFIAFLANVLDVIEGAPPAPSPSCSYCRYRESA